MNFFYLMLTACAAAFLISAVFIPARLNKHIDSHAVHFILAESLSFRPLKFLAGKLLKYFVWSVILCLILMNAALLANVWLKYSPDYTTALFCLLASSAAFLVNSVLICLAATLYLGHKRKHTPII